MKNKLIWYVLMVCLVGISLCRFIPYDFAEEEYTTVTGLHGQPIIGDMYAGYESIDSIPAWLRKKLVNIEDRRFFYHIGIDPIAWGRAVVAYLKHGSVQGGSTIHQQVVKLDHNNFARSVPNKLREIVGSVQVGLQYSHDDVLLRYINTIQRKNNVHGRHAACSIFRGKPCEHITIQEFYILLAAAQRGYNVLKKAEYELILLRAHNLCMHYESDTSACAAINNDLLEQVGYARDTVDPRVQDMVLALQEHGFSGSVFDYDIYSTINTVLEKTALVRREYGADACCVVVFTDGGLVSANICGSWDDQAYGKTNSCMIPRQTGSAIKPFLYTYAMKNLGLQPDDTIEDTYVAYDLGDGSLYEPKNFDLRFHGTVTIAQALGNSFNVPAVKLLEQVGVDGFYGFIKDLLHVYAITDTTTKTADDVGLSMALGTYEISPLDFTMLWQFLLRTETGGVFERYTTYIDAVYTILQDPSNKVISFGQDTFLSTPGWAVKTGTSRKFIDGWICGASRGTIRDQQNYSICIWVGNHTNKAMHGSSSEVAGFLRSEIVDIIDRK